MCRKYKNCFNCYSACENLTPITQILACFFLQNFYFIGKRKNNKKHGINCLVIPFSPIKYNFVAKRTWNYCILSLCFLFGYYLFMILLLTNRRWKRLSCASQTLAVKQMICFDMNEMINLNICALFVENYMWCVWISWYVLVCVSSVIIFIIIF